MMTASGYHYYLTWLGCQRRWYIQHLCKLHKSTGQLPVALPFGTAIHHTLSTFYRNPLSKQGLITAFQTQFDLALQEWPPDTDRDPDELEYMRDVRGPNSLLDWHAEIGERLHDHYTCVETEIEHTFHLANGSAITFKPDRIIQSKETGRRFIIETKTTGRSLTYMAELVAEEDQSTTYLLGAKQLDMDIDAIVPEILYSRGKVYKSAWPFEISRSKAELADWNDTLATVSEELNQRVEAYETGNYTVGMLFPRFPRGCSYQGRCTHPEICRCPPTPQDPVPAGYRRIEDPPTEDPE